MAQEIDNNFIDQCTNKMNELLSSTKDKGDSNMQLILEAFKQLVLLILTSFRTLLNAHNDLKDLNEKSVNLLEQIQREKEELKQEKEELKQEKDELKQENEKLKQALLASSKVNANNIITNEQNKKKKNLKVMVQRNNHVKKV